ncbi:Uncharacterised protein [Salmonella bongori]|nr:Uncharacterised protein [Salmonella bongori]
MQQINLRGGHAQYQTCIFDLNNYHAFARAERGTGGYLEFTRAISFWGEIPYA